MMTSTSAQNKHNTMSGVLMRLTINKIADTLVTSFDLQYPDQSDELREQVIQITSLALAGVVPTDTNINSIINEITEQLLDKFEIIDSNDHVLSRDIIVKVCSDAFNQFLTEQKSSTTGIVSASTVTMPSESVGVLLANNNSNAHLAIQMVQMVTRFIAETPDKPIILNINLDPYDFGITDDDLVTELQDSGFIHLGEVGRPVTKDDVYIFLGSIEKYLNNGVWNNVCCADLVEEENGKIYFNEGDDDICYGSKDCYMYKFCW